MKIKIKRIYDKPSKNDGARILIDRLWPRGISKKEANLDYWIKEVAPSNELRKWFNHEPVKFKDFKKRYQKELSVNPALSELKKVLTESKTSTLLYAAKNSEINHAVVLKDFLKRKCKGD
ncbi:MAG TPA: DUF488 domain-containing protein [Candidatus Moranbacteria bacterium]|nr:DUF488 domain-containing protein [Candidatus Moranbacteria bacterium]